MTLLTGAESGSLQTLLANPSGGVRRPRVPAEKVESFEHEVQRTTIVERGRSLEDAVSSWRERAEAVLQQAQQLALQFPDSPAAAARSVQAALVLGDDDLVRREAERCLAIAFGRDTPASYVAMSSLIRVGELDQILSGSVDELHPTLAVLVATALADRGRYDEAEKLVNHSEAAAGRTLYAFLVSRRDAGLAVRSLRSVLRENPNDANARFMLAQLRAREGNWQQAIKHGLTASRVAPGRRDISMALMQMMLDAGRLDEVQAEIRQLKLRGVIETPDFLIMQANVQLVLEHRRRAISLFKQASSKIQSGQRLRAEVDANVLMLARADESRRAVDPVASVRQSFREHPDSVVLGSMLFDLLTKVSDAPELQLVLGNLEKSGAPESDLLRLRTRLAYVNCDWEAVVPLAEAWRAHDPRAQLPTRLLAMVLGQIQSRWDAAADLMAAAMLESPDSWLANDAAYVAALAGQVGRAVDFSTWLDTSDYASRATMGLVKIVSGRVDEGLKLYREAAEMTESAKETRLARSLMTVHQAMALRRVLARSEFPIDVRAASLPAVDLPIDWEDHPSFRLLHDACIKRGWSWPVVIA